METMDKEETIQEEIASLKQKIAARKKFLGRVVPAILKLIREHGKTSVTERGRYHTNVLTTLKAFGGFDFTLDEGHSEMGGSSLEVRTGVCGWMDVRRGWAMKLAQHSPRFETDEGWIEETTVNGFVNEEEWQGALEHTLGEIDTLVAKMLAKEREQQEGQTTQVGLRREFAALVEEAKRYGISTPE